MTWAARSREYYPVYLSQCHDSMFHLSIITVVPLVVRGQFLGLKIYLRNTSSLELVDQRRDWKGSGQDTVMLSFVCVHKLALNDKALNHLNALVAGKPRQKRSRPHLPLYPLPHTGLRGHLKLSASDIVSAQVSPVHGVARPKATEPGSCIWRRFAAAFS